MPTTDTDKNAPAEGAFTPSQLPVHPGLGEPKAGPFPYIDNSNMHRADAYVFAGICRPEFLFLLPGENPVWTAELKGGPIYNLRPFLERRGELVFLCQTAYLADAVEKTGRLAVALPVSDPLTADLRVFRGRDVVLVHHHEEDPEHDWRYDCLDALHEAHVGSVRLSKLFMDVPDFHTLFDEENPEAILVAAEQSREMVSRDPNLHALDGNSSKHLYRPLEPLLTAPDGHGIILPAEGMGVVAADGGTGKSFLGHRLCLAVACKGAGVDIPVMGMDVHQGGLAVYLTSEDNLTTVDDNTEQMLYNVEMDYATKRACLSRFIRKPYASLSSTPEMVAFDAKTKQVRQLPEFTKIRRQMHQLVERRGEPIRVIVFDNASQMLAVDSDKQFEVVKAMRVLSSLSAEFGCLVVLLAHVRKGGQGYADSKSAADAVMGSAGWKTGVRWMWVMWKDDKEGDEQDPTKGADEDEPARKEVVIKGSLVKSNLGKRMYLDHILTFIRRTGGADFIHVPDGALSSAAARKAERVRKRILYEIQAAYTAKKPHNKTSFETAKWPDGTKSIKDPDLAKLGQKTRRDLLKAAIETGTVLHIDDGKGLWAPTTNDLLQKAKEEGL